MEVIIASNNKDKIREIKDLLGDRFTLFSLNEKGINIDFEETGNTFFENALIKAKAVAEACGIAAIADDSGLIVDGLNGMPGVHSARYGGEHGDNDANNCRLLFEMQKITDKSARFISTVVLYYPSGEYVFGEGTVEGLILNRKIGKGGFGYDPLFYCIELKKSFGEAAKEEKNAVSHRHRALQDLLSKL